jgi:hypothetical protein
VSSFAPGRERVRPHSLNQHKDPYNEECFARPGHLEEVPHRADRDHRLRPRPLRFNVDTAVLDRIFAALPVYIGA